MIHLTTICKQHGAQILFQDASLQILPSTRTGLVGPNGAGKTTIFRLITGEEEADRGEISCARKTVIGYFSQDVGEMSGRSVLDEVMSAAGEIARMGDLMREMEAQMSEPMADDDLASPASWYFTPACCCSSSPARGARCSSSRRRWTCLKARRSHPTQRGPPSGRVSLAGRSTWISPSRSNL